MNRRVLGAGLAVVVPLLVVLIVNLGRNPHAIRSPLVGQAAPPFELQQVGGGMPVSLAEMRGKPVVINFWATWCIPCLEEHKALQDGARRFDSRVQFLGIVYEDEEALALRYLGQRGSAYPSLMDAGGRTAIAYGVAGVPETYFIDASGIVVSKYAGPLSRDEIDFFLRKAGGES